MSINLRFDTGDLSSEEGVGLRALLDAIQPSLEPAAALRERTVAMYTGTAPIAPAYAPERALPEAAQDAKTVTETGEAPEAEAKPKKTRRSAKAEAPVESPAEEPAAEETSAAVDDPETAAQDAADEQAEVDANRDPDAPVTVDDLKAAYLPYMEKFGKEATLADGPKLFKSVLGDPPADANGWTTAAIIEQGQDKARKVIEAWTKAAAADKRFGG